MIVQNRKILFLSLFVFAFGCLPLFSQDDPYRAEIGLQAGFNIYAGDINSIGAKSLFLNNLKNIRTDAGGMFRYRFNQRLALRLGYDLTSVKGNYQYLVGDTKYSLALNNPLHTVDLWGEFNFFDLNNNPYKRFSKRYSPFIFAGLGGIYMPENRNTGSKKLTLTIPFGVGFKMKLSQRWNFNILMTNRLLLKDNLEGNPEFDNPIPKTEFNPMNNDLLMGFNIGFSYDFWKRGCNCNNTSTESNTASKKR